MLLTKKENDHWAKYYGQDFINNDEFWQDCLEVYYNRNIGLPLLYNTLTITKLIKRLKCPSGECGECCKCYKVVPLSAYDIRRFQDNGIDTSKLITLQDGGVTIDADKSGRCPYLKEDNSCSVYAFRPETCFIFPIQKGKEGEQLNVRLKCQPALDLIRKVITDAINEGGKLLLPDLTVIQIGG
jgi:Fe-S-cluster containining protein